MQALAQTSFAPSFNTFPRLPSDAVPGQRNGRPFCFTFFDSPAPVTAMTESARVIVERNGIFCIADIFEPSPVALDLDFKGLVDSVMGK